MKRFALALALAPTAVLSLLAAARMALPVVQGFRQNLAFLAGLAAYPLLHFFLLRPLRLYVFGHELTHAFAAVLSGARVKRFVAGKESGHVVVSHSNTFIALAPYFVPIYSLLVLLAYRLIGLWDPNLIGRGLFLAAMGASLAFHWVLTVDILTGESQKDLSQAGGVFFSMVMIALANACVIALIFKFLFPQVVSLWDFTAAVSSGTLAFWKETGHGAAALARTLDDIIAKRTPARAGA